MTRPNAVAQVVFFYIGWLLAVATVLPIPLMAVITVWWLARSYQRRVAEHTLARAHLEERNMLDIGNFFGGK